MVMDINLNYCNDHFVIYANIEQSCHTPETNINYI